MEYTIAKSGKSELSIDETYMERYIFPDVFGNFEDSAQYMLDYVQAKAFLNKRTYKLSGFVLKTLPEPLKLSKQIMRGKYISPRGQFNQQTIDLIFALKYLEKEN